MKTQEQIDGIKAVVLYILQHFKEGVDYIKLFKIMYFAQRKYLSTYGLCVVEDTFKARPRGPVPSLTYKVVKMVENGDSFDECPDLKDFADSVTVDKEQKVSALLEPDMYYIATMERKVLDETIETYKDVPSEKLSEMSHDAAYKKACKMMELDPERDTMTRLDIARAGGASKEMIEHIREYQLIERALAS